jgi:hypothetical protein
MRTERASERWPSGPAQAGGPGEAPLPVREIKKADSERALMTAASTRRYARLSTYVSGKVVPSAALMVRIRRVALHAREADARLGPVV